MKDKLNQLSRVLKSIHKRLLENERIQAEKHFGRSISPFEFLGILTQDKNFAWLQPFLKLIVEIDTFVDDSESVTAEDFARFRAQTAQMLAEPILAGRYKHHQTHDEEFAFLDDQLANIK